ncbi:MAG: hypothetical protein SV760_01680, partial [Halobacteria archaeon]|nr:hypothetical protein [Halobacteria archaeon]
DWMGDALDGGEGGSEVVRRFLLDARRVLSDGGRVLLLLSSLTDLDGVRRTARDEGFDFERVAHESLFFEELVVLRLEPG